MNRKPINTYFELARLTRFLRELIEENQLDINNLLIPLIGIRCAGIKTEDLGTYKCRANHYLKDALGVEELPRVEVFSHKFNMDSLDKLRRVISENAPLLPIGTTIERLDNIAELLIDILREKEIIKGKDKLFTDDQKEYLKENGYLIIPRVLTEDEVKRLSKLTLFIAEKENEAGISYRYGDEKNTLQRIYNLISKHPSYIELLELPLVKEILDYYFDRDNLHHKYVLSSFHSNIIYPGGPAQQLHVDGWSFSGVPLPQWSTRLNVNFILTDWTETNGATLVVPRSHKLFRAPNPEEVPQEDLLKLVAPKGSLVLWTGHTWHQSGTNNSSAPRFGLFACFAASQLKEVSTEEEHLSIVDAEVMEALSPEFRFMIGLDRGIKKGALHRVNFADTKFNNMIIEKN